MAGSPAAFTGILFFLVSNDEIHNRADDINEEDDQHPHPFGTADIFAFA